MIGFGKPRIAMTPGLMTSRRSVVTSRAPESPACRSAPAQNESPAPVMTMTRVSSSNDSLIVSVKRRIVSKSTELRRAGLLNVMRLTPPSRLTRSLPDTSDIVEAPLVRELILKGRVKSGRIVAQEAEVLQTPMSARVSKRLLSQQLIHHQSLNVSQPEVATL